MVTQCREFGLSISIDETGNRKSSLVNGFSVHHTLHLLLFLASVFFFSVGDPTKQGIN